MLWCDGSVSYLLGQSVDMTLDCSCKDKSVLSSKLVNDPSKVMIDSERFG